MISRFSIFLLLSIAPLANAIAQQPWIRVSDKQTLSDAKLISLPHGLYVSDTATWISYNHGSTWSFVNSLPGRTEDLTMMYGTIGLALRNQQDSGRALVSVSLAGASWTDVDTIKMEGSATCLAVAGQDYLVGNTKGKIYLRADELSVLTIDATAEPTIHQILVTPSLWFASTSAGIYLSDNGGLTWTRSPLPFPTDYSNDAVCGRMVIGSFGSVMCATKSGVWFYHTGDKTWKPRGEWSVTIPRIDDLQVYANSVFAVVPIPDSGYQMFRLSSSDASWQAASGHLSVDQTFSPRFAVDGGIAVMIVPVGADSVKGVYTIDITNFSAVATQEYHDASIRLVGNSIQAKLPWQGRTDVYFYDVMGRLISNTSVLSDEGSVSLTVPSGARGTCVAVFSSHAGRRSFLFVSPP